MSSLNLFEHIPFGVIRTDCMGHISDTNPSFCQFISYTNTELLQLRFQDLIYPDDLGEILKQREHLISNHTESFTLEGRWVTQTSQIRWAQLTMSLIRTEANSPSQLMIVQDITERRQQQMVQAFQEQQRHLLDQMTRQMHHSLNTQQVLETAVHQIRSLLAIDRVVLYRFESDWSGYVIAESLEPGWPSMLGCQIYDPCLAEETCIIPYTQGRIQRTSDIHTAGFAECYVQLLDQFQVKANLVVPILETDTLWGLIAAQHCRAPRAWSDVEIDLLEQFSTSLSIAIQQAQLYQTIQSLNQDLEQQVERRTQKLQQVLRFEALLRRIIEKVRESLGEDEILSTAVQELGEELTAVSCNTTLFDESVVSGWVTHDYTHFDSSLTNHAFQTSSYPELFQQITAGWSVQLCHLDPSLPRSRHTCLICPIADDQGVIGGLWLNRRADQIFSEVEVDLVEQVALQCAIGLRQARLYWAAQQQVSELERLNLLKDDFLSTISHELRTPLTNIRMALYMFKLTHSEEKRQQYYDMAVSECTRQAILIDDLLNLQNLEIGQYESQSVATDLQALVAKLVDPLTPNLKTRGQQLQLDLLQSLPCLNTDPIALERILRELLENAHKHSSEGGMIRFQITEQDGGLQFRISNSGELPTEELPHLFEKFYRVPTPDRWRHRGTGLGLALVHRFVGVLEGKLWVSQDQGWIHFTCWIPKGREAKLVGET